MEQRLPADVGDRLQIERLVRAPFLVESWGMATGARQKSPRARARGDSMHMTGTREVLDVLPAAVYVTDASGRIVYRNKAAADLAGRQPALGREFSLDCDPLPHTERPTAAALREDRAICGAEAIGEQPDGANIGFVPHSVPLHDAAGNFVGVVNMMVDASDRRSAEIARGHLAAIVESSDDAIVGKTLDGIVTSWNRGAETIFGYREEEMIGQSIKRLFPADRLSEEDLILERIRRGERVEHFETVRRRKDGREIDVSVAISPVRDPVGRIVGASKIARDISDKKRAEKLLHDLNDRLEQRVAERTRDLAEASDRLLAATAERERTEAELLQARKMEAIGQLVSGLAHDFNNLLAAVLGNLELLEMRLDDPALHALVQAAARSARRGAKLNEQLLAFSRKQHLSPRAVNLNELVIGARELLDHSLGSAVEVMTLPAPNLWAALVDPHQLELVVLNLAINARDAMPLGGRILIETGNVDADAPGKPPELPPGDFVAITISDGGTGMTQDVLVRACEPFFTTKEPGKGSGLGLAQVYGLAQQSGGGLRIRSAPDEGTSVTVYLPRSERPPDKPAELAEIARPVERVGRARVLVVDDDEEVRGVLVAYLQTLGYPTLEAAASEQALALLATHRSDIGLVVADYAMPGMSGAALADRVHRQWPEMPVIIVTGYAETTEFVGRRDERSLLHKPFRIDELAAAIEHAKRHRAKAVRMPQTAPLPIQSSALHEA
jgi:PAS domain S-box-containing protein